ncbi:MAG: hypothetical protein SYC29_16935 [Planctomycetota bacterium]|nr:hypothetical protein [Planctomycetota bacterium]
MSQDASGAHSMFTWSAARQTALEIDAGVAPPPARLPWRTRSAPRREPGGEARRRIAAPDRDMTRVEHVKELAGACRHLIRREDTATLVIDLADVEQADTKLVACLVGVYRLACSRAVRVEMIVPRPVRDLVVVCRLEPLIEQTRPRRKAVAPRRR